MKRITTRSFLRTEYARAIEPVEVWRGLELLGVWYPAGTQPEEQAASRPGVAALGTGSTSPAPPAGRNGATTAGGRLARDEAYRKVAATQGRKR